MAGGAHAGVACSAGTQCDPVPGGATIRIAVCGESAGRAGIRLSPDGDAGDGSRNVETFAGMLVVDKSTGNANGRQAAFWRKMREKKYTTAFIDQGYCFNAGEWTFPDYPLRGVYARNEVYAGVRGWESFEPWLGRVREDGSGSAVGAGRNTPPEWYGSEWDAMEKLVRMLSSAGSACGG